MAAFKLGLQGLTLWRGGGGVRQAENTGAKARSRTLSFAPGMLYKPGSQDQKNRCRVPTCTVGLEGPEAHLCKLLIKALQLK